MLIWETMPDTRKCYKSDKITVFFEPKLCIHAAECVRKLHDVFDVNRRPWVNPEGADPDKIAEVIQLCPSGALEFERYDGGPQEAVPAVATITVVQNGPFYVRGNVEIRDKDGNLLRKCKRVALCACGQSRNKPFCDESHRKVKFDSRRNVN